MGGLQRDRVEVVRWRGCSEAAEHCDAVVSSLVDTSLVGSKLCGSQWSVASKQPRHSSHPILLKPTHLIRHTKLNGPAESSGRNSSKDVLTGLFSRTVSVTPDKMKKAKRSAQKEIFDILPKSMGPIHAALSLMFLTVRKLERQRQKTNSLLGLV